MQPFKTTVAKSNLDSDKVKSDLGGRIFQVLRLFLPKSDFARTLGLCLLLAILITPAAHAQTIQDNVWMADGIVRSVVTDGNTIYLGGDFFSVGPLTGPGVAISATTGAVDFTLPRVRSGGGYGGDSGRGRRVVSRRRFHDGGRGDAQPDRAH